MECPVVNQPKQNLSGPVQVLILFVLAFVGLLVSSVISMIFKLGPVQLSHIFTSIILQDVLVFIVPAIAAMALYYHRPLNVMGLNTSVSWKGILTVIIICIISIPAMNWIVDWNNSLHLPQLFSGIENKMRMMEEAAQKVTETLLGGISVGSLLVNILIVGFMAGLSEEIFFRGGILKMLSSSWNMHIAIWVAAIIFSAIHMQFFGFVPRLLLGAWFGYLLWWTRSLWVPIIAHTLNNSIVVVTTWLCNNGHLEKSALDSVGLPENGEMPWLAISSAAATVILICAAKKVFFQKK